MKKHSSFSNSQESSGADSRQVMSELVTQLTKQLKAGSAVGREGKDAPDASKPNLNRLTVGVDLGDQWSNYCILGVGGETLIEGQFRTSPQPIGEFFKDLCRSRVVIEVGTHSAWVREVIAGIGHEVLVANARRMDGSKRRRRKNDRIDAAKLARLGRVDPKSLYPIQHRSTEVREDLVVLRARGALVESRTKLVSTVRGLVKTMGGTRLSTSSTDAFSKKVAAEVPQPIRETIQPLLRLIASLSEEIRCYDKKIEQLAREKYQHTQLLRQVTGVGPVTSLAYVLTLETPLRFTRSRDVGPYLGLVPAQEDSGDSQPQLGISMFYVNLTGHGSMDPGRLERSLFGIGEYFDRAVLKQRPGTDGGRNRELKVRRPRCCEFQCIRNSWSDCRTIHICKAEAQIVAG